ncbi:ROK family protein [Bauldia sp.]|uniref:ROK family transcriptional regulator n=1 Tax=Bauldia sp. TaxID=2575872 RepID=UPI0025C56924|nr:ROK family protein [Bauldia sp.]
MSERPEKPQDPDRRRTGNPFAGTGHLLSLIMSGRASSRAALVEATQLSRATVAQRLSYLFDAGLVAEADETLPSGGRPARALRLNTDFGVVLAADIGEHQVRVAVTDLRPSVITQTLTRFDLRRGPVETLGFIADQAEALLRQLRQPKEKVLGIGLSLPAPVDFAAGHVVGPSIMTGWDAFDIRGWLAARLGVEAVADNDVNLLALHYHHLAWRDVGDFFFVKAGTGIGSGVYAGGAIYRGADGASGDIGHIQLGSADGPLCRCGKLGCVEARAAGWAIARDLRAQGIEARDAKDVLALVEQNRPEAVTLVRRSGQVIGEAIADVVSILNPRVVAVGGTLAGTSDHLLSGIRELVYQRCLPLATRKLQITLVRPQEHDGLLGAALLTIDSRLAPEQVDRMLTARAAQGVDRPSGDTSRSRTATFA